EAIPMHNLALEQVRHCREVDVRMRADVQAATGIQLQRAKVIEEQERTDRLRRSRGKQPAHAKPVTEMTRTRFELMHDDRLGGFRALRLRMRKDTHQRPPFAERGISPSPGLAWCCAGVAFAP